MENQATRERYDLLRQYQMIKADNDALQAHNKKLHAEIMALKSSPSECINLNTAFQGCSSSRSENSSDVKLDISVSANDSPLTCSRSRTPLFHAALSNLRHDHHHQPPQMVKEESLSTNMFCTTEDQTGFWPWLDQQHFD
ncbi:Detected protein of unknown function [Hibiscus syriacus]|uniref:Leucine zipper homeobox-associated domain-containing protein n=1 Tax=Hibiscus syriacus TaxID=106335 RepID=A0A6A3CXG4_HIBSY|nr:Detected protein of unknown function [Hibiscus syriacus]